MLTFIFWDVQHGHACYIRTPNGRHFVVDLGTGSYSENKPFSPMSHLKDKWGVQQLDYVVITHPHRDHIDDIFSFDALAPKTLHRPKHLSEAEVLGGNKNEDADKVKKYLEISGRYTVPVQAGSDSDVAAPQHWGGVKISFFMTSECNAGNLNNHSIVTVFEYAYSKVIIPGDNEADSWKSLITRADFVAAAKNPDIFLAPHHGRKAGYCPELFAAIGKPSLTIISDGPYCDTSATGSYGGQSKGWLVHYPDGSKEQRNCVTTRQDGWVQVKAYIGTDNKPYLIVNVQKGSAAK